MASYVWYDSTRPISHPERKVCRDSAKQILALSPLDPSIHRGITEAFRPKEATYQRARSAHLRAKAAANTARSEVAAADSKFDISFRNWKDTVKDAQGRVMVQQLKELLGGTLPSAFTELPWREEITIAEDLFEQLTASPALLGNPEMLAAFRAAYEHLEALVPALENAEKVEETTAKALLQAERAFDRAWGIVVRTVHNTKSKHAAVGLLPTFRRKRKVNDAPNDPSAQTRPADDIEDDLGERDLGEDDLEEDTGSDAPGDDGVEDEIESEGADASEGEPPQSETEGEDAGETEHREAPAA